MGGLGGLHNTFYLGGHFKGEDLKYAPLSLVLNLTLEIFSVFNSPSTPVPSTATPIFPLAVVVFAIAISKSTSLKCLLNKFG